MHQLKHRQDLGRASRPKQPLDIITHIHQEEEITDHLSIIPEVEVVDVGHHLPPQCILPLLVLILLYLLTIHTAMLGEVGVITIIIMVEVFLPHI